MMLRIGKLSHLRNRGFTFIELVLVAVIILVAAGLSVPLFRKSFSSLHLKTTCQDLVRLMRYVQTKSIVERRVCRVNFDLEKAFFWPTVQDETSRGEYKEIKGRWGKAVKIPNGILVESDIEDNASFISFYPDGSSTKAEIKLHDKKGKTFIITTQRTIGYAEVKE